MRFRISVMWFVAMMVALGLTAGVANALTEYFEDFETGFTGSAIENHADWYCESGTVPTAGVGLNGSVGLPPDGQIMSWAAHAFSWANDLAVGDVVIMGMDYEGSSTGNILDDDRVGFMHTQSVVSDDIFAVQCDPTYQIQTYWENGGGNNRTTLATISPVAGTWYRFRVTFTKLTDTSCSIDASFIELDGSGDPMPATEVTGRMDDSSLSTPLYSMNYFTDPVQYPAYKNYNENGNADNAYFAIGPLTPTATLVSPIDWAYVDVAELVWLRPDPMNDGDPGVVTVNVYFGTDPNLIVGLNGTVQPETGAAVDSTSNFGTPLDMDTTYYWRVDVIDPNYGAPITFEGNTWSFVTTIPAEVIITESGGSTEVSEEGETSDSYNIRLSKSPAQPVTVTPGPLLVSPLDIRISSGTDDAEEHTDAGENGRMESITSTDLELGREDAFPDQQLCGMRFNSINIPTGATITSAYLEFTVDEADSGQMSLTILGELSLDVPDTFTTVAYNLSSRPRTSAEVYWIDLPDWTQAMADAQSKQQTPDISSIISEITGQDGWAAGNSLVLLVEAYGGSTGGRTAESYNGDVANAPLLHIEWTVGTGQLPVSWSPPAVVLDDTNWELGEDVTVTAVDDSLVETDPHMFTLPNAVSSADAAWNVVTADDVVVSIIENDCGAWGYLALDLNQDCVIGLGDLALFASQFGQCTDPQNPVCDDGR